MKLKTLLNPEFNDGLTSLSSARLPEKTSYLVAKKILKIRKEQQIFQVLRDDKIRFFSAKDETLEAVKDEHGNIHVAPENVAKYTSEVNKLLDLEIDLEPIKLDDLGDKHGMTPNDFIKLDDFICE